MGRTELVEKDRGRLIEAFDLASLWHGRDVRKGTDVPYLSHLLQVAGLVLEHGGDSDAAIAGLLHDALEDTKTPAERAGREEELRRRFGQPVLDLVLACTDTGPDEAAGSKRPWRERKEAYLAHLREERGPGLLVAACDKRHNLGALVSDLREHGPRYLDRFNAGPSEQIWYFESFVDALRGGGWPRLEEELTRLVSEFREIFRAAPIVAGVDGCKAGWLLIWRNVETGEIGCEVHAHAESLLSRRPRPAVLAIDIPIGLPDAGRRLCDQAARKLLGGKRASSVFPAPIRPSLTATSREEASRIGRQVDGRGVGAQAWGIYPKIREIDEALVRHRVGRSVREVHPEVSFREWAGGRTIEASKHSAEGQRLRRRLVEDHFGVKAFDEVRQQLKAREAQADDILDAFAALWTAERVRRGEAKRVPEEPLVDAQGLPMEIVY